MSATIMKGSHLWARPDIRAHSNAGRSGGMDALRQAVEDNDDRIEGYLHRSDQFLAQICSSNQSSFFGYLKRMITGNDPRALSTLLVLMAHLFLVAITISMPDEAVPPMIKAGVISFCVWIIVWVLWNFAAPIYRNFEASVLEGHTSNLPVTLRAMGAASLLVGSKALYLVGREKRAGDWDVLVCPYEFILSVETKRKKGLATIVMRMHNNSHQTFDFPDLQEESATGSDMAVSDILKMKVVEANKEALPC